MLPSAQHVATLAGTRRLSYIVYLVDKEWAAAEARRAERPLLIMPMQTKHPNPTAAAVLLASSPYIAYIIIIIIMRKQNTLTPLQCSAAIVQPFAAVHRRLEPRWASPGEYVWFGCLFCLFVCVIAAGRRRPRAVRIGSIVQGTGLPVSTREYP